MFWALFVVGHDWCVIVPSASLRARRSCILDCLSVPLNMLATTSHVCLCPEVRYITNPVSFPLRSGHGSFSNNRRLNDFIGNVVHSSILVPYHGWRISHRTHHANHGHVENDESWYPTTEKLYDNMVRNGQLITAVC